MERQRQRTLLEWVRDKVESFFAAVSTFVARALLGKNLFEEEYRKLSMQEEAKKMFDNAEKDKGEEVKNKEKAAENVKEVRQEEQPKAINVSQLMNSKNSFQELFQNEDVQLLNDLVNHLKENNLNVMSAEYCDDPWGKYMQFKILDKDQEEQIYSIAENGESKDLGFSRFIEKYCVDHEISMFLTQEKQMESLIKEIQKSEIEGRECYLSVWNHSYKINSENGKTRVMLDNKEVFSGQLDLPRFEADNVNVFIISDQKLIDMNQHALSNMIEAMYHAELEEIGYDILNEKEQVCLNDIVEMNTSFQNIMKQQDINFLDKLRVELCKETGLPITTSYILPPKSLDMHGKESLLQINIGEGEQEKHIMIDEYGCILENEMPDEEVSKALQRVCIQENIALLPDLKDFSQCLLDEAKYDIVVGNERSSLNFWGNEIVIQQGSRQDEISVHCNGRQLYSGGLENLMDQNIVKDIYEGVYEEGLSFLGYDVVENDQNVDTYYDQPSFTQEEMDAAQQDFMTEQQRQFEEDQMPQEYFDHSECCGPNEREEDNFIWEEVHDER